MSQIAPAGPSLITLLEKAGIGRSSLIRVTGPSGLSALLWLCRHGFEQVGYLRPGHGPHEQPDCLIVAHTCDEAALAALLEAGPHVRDGGVVVFQSHLPEGAGRGGDDPIHRLLRRWGYDVETCLLGRRRELHVARRRAHVWLDAA